MCCMSQPTRAAWIEIMETMRIGMAGICRSPLGLRGLKYKVQVLDRIYIESQPTRAAWIEIYNAITRPAITVVAAHSGCVD